MSYSTLLLEGIRRLFNALESFIEAVFGGPGPAQAFTKSLHSPWIVLWPMSPRSKMVIAEGSPKSLILVNYIQKWVGKIQISSSPSY
jgi:hypothetical protein